MDANNLTYESCKAALVEQGYWEKPQLKMKVRNNTFIRYVERPKGLIFDFIEVLHHSTVVATLYSNGLVRISTGGHRSRTTIDRLNSVLRPIEHRAYLMGNEARIVLPNLDDIRLVDDLIVGPPSE